MGATIVTEVVGKSMEKDSGYYSTYGWHPLGVEAAIATLTYYKNNKDSLLHHVDVMSDYFYDRLFEMPFESELEIRVAGLAIALKFKEEKYAEKIKETARKNGLIISAEEKSIKLFPALTIDMATAKRGLDLLEKSL